LSQRREGVDGVGFFHSQTSIVMEITSGIRDILSTGRRRERIARLG